MDLHSRRMIGGSVQYFLDMSVSPQLSLIGGYDESMYWSAFRIKSKLLNIEPK